MGCTSSKLEDLPAIALCRDRCSFLESAIHQRYALSETHLAYTQSLKGISHSLHQFINHHHRNEEEDDDDSWGSKPKLINHSDSGSGHLVFDSDSDSDDDDDDDSLHSSPLHHHLDDPNEKGSYLHMNYMKNSSIPPSLVYEQRVSSPQRVYIGESSNYNPYSLPPPPSPPREKVWDFLNPFDTYYTPYTPSRQSREIREELDIPDLEEDDDEVVVVKEVHGKQKIVTKASVDDPSSGNSGASTSGGGQASLYQTRPSVLVEKEEKEHVVHVVEKKVVENEARRSNAAAAARGGGGGRRRVPEVAKDIEAQFLRAAESGSEIAMMLEVGKHHYGRKNVSSKKRHEVTPSRSTVSSAQSLTSKKAKAEASSSSSSSAAALTYADIEAELALKSRNLSSTLHKLHLWEKKLYDEVKAEEKLRVTHEKNLRKLQRLDERGAEDQKVDSTRKLVRSLSSKIRIAIQVVDKISITINKIRDEELWLQLNELIQGLSKMWKSMLECHRSQCVAIKEARGLGPIGSRQKKLGDDHLEATKMVGHDLINWVVGFSSWVSAQKGFVRELNSWLMKCLFYEPEETADGIIPFSPGRIGAPLIFVICNHWEQALDRISEKEVIEAMRRFTTSVLHLWEQDRLETRERMMGHGDSRNMDREEQKLQKEIQELERKMGMVGQEGEDNIVYQSDTSNESLQGSLQRIFEAMERFTEESMKAYENLLHRVEEDNYGSGETDED